MLRTFLCLTLAAVHLIACAGRNVSFDGRALLLDGERKLLVSGSVHYPRHSAGQWRDLFKLAKAGGVDVIQTYIFWNIHETSKGVYDFSGNKDLFKFIETAAEEGLYVTLRVGPYVNAEWNYGGIPAWIRDEAGLKLRTDNAVFEAAVESWVRYVVGKVQERNLFYPQGGPIILAQIENEFGSWNNDITDQPRIKYVAWNIELTRSLNVSVPWVMCKNDYPVTTDDVIATCNGNYCHDWIPAHKAQHPNQPSLFTENWPGWFQQWGQAKPARPVEDLAYSVAHWFAAGGSLMNYYMYQGGTNFARIGGGPFDVTSYYDHVMIDAYGVPVEPNYSHIKALHAVIHELSELLLAVYPTPAQSATNNTSVFAYVYEHEDRCAAFVVNTHGSDFVVSLGSVNGIPSPAWSVTILKDCKNVVFSTAKVTVKPSPSRIQSAQLPLKEWSVFSEPIHWSSNAENISSKTPMRHFATTKDASDYLSIFTTVNIPSPVASTTLAISQVSDIVLQVLVNGVVAGRTSFSATNVTYSGVSLVAGDNEIVLVQASMGLKSGGMGAGSLWDCGVGGSKILLDGKDITSNTWVHRVGTFGEHAELYDVVGASHVEWNPLGEMQVSSIDDPNPAATWYKSDPFDLPHGFLDFPLALVPNGLMKGTIWVNGYNLGRYFNIIAPHVAGCDTCSYAGNYNHANKCMFDCDKLSQELYHVPRDWLLEKDNVVTIFEEMGGAPDGVVLGQHVVGGATSLENILRGDKQIAVEM